MQSSVVLNGRLPHCSIACRQRTSTAAPVGKPSLRSSSLFSSKTAEVFLAFRRLAHPRVCRVGTTGRRPKAPQAGAVSFSPPMTSATVSDGTAELVEAAAASSLDLQQDFRILKEELSYSRYLNVYNRIVEYPAEQCSLAYPSSGDPAAAKCRKVVEYDVVAARTISSHFCVTVPYDTKAKTFTLVKEYSQGANHMVYGVPAGGLTETHVSKEDCARAELSEEVHLCGGRLVRLLDPAHPGLLEVKWCRNRFTPFLVLDPVPDMNPGQKDHEEYIEVVTIDVPGLRKLMYSGDMMLPSVVACGMALEYLEKERLL